MQYRREIDGLRAIAVVPVILFHAGIAGFAGGFVGVDVFFVISGYLITSILKADLASGTFSLTRFYERRARRILPALFFVIACCLPFAWWLMSPSELKEFGEGLVAVSLFSSNVLFWIRTDYFAAAAELNPLLHTWSLAVEEQFYIFFPLLLWLLWKRGSKTVFLSIGALCLVSLALSEWASRHAPAANFFLIFTRSWELGVGALCALATDVRTRYTDRQGVLASLGLSMIALAVIYFDSDTPFPSLYAILPVFGTALVILFAAPTTYVGRFLSLAPIVGLGLISYSAYLWHQPLFAFARLYSLRHLSDWSMLILAVVSLALAWITWILVEQPIRRGGGVLQQQKGLFIASSAGILLCLVLGVAGHLSQGFSSLRTTQAQAALLKTILVSPFREKCHVSQTGYREADAPCTYHDGRVRWAVLGNSHGVELAYALADTLKLRQEGLVHFTISGCRPAFGMSESDRFCGSWTDDAATQIAENREIDFVVLSYAVGDMPDEIIGAYMNTVEFFKEAGKTVILVLEVPRLPVDIKRLIFRDRMQSLVNIEGQARNTALIYGNKVREASRNLTNDVIIVDPFDAFCNDVTCYAVLDGKALFFDDHHVSLSGAAIIAQQILSAVASRTVTTVESR